MQADKVSFGKQMLMRWRQAKRRADLAAADTLKAKAAIRKLAILAHHQQFQVWASASVLVMLLLVSPLLARPGLMVLIALMMAGTLAHNRLRVRQLHNQLRQDAFDPRIRDHLFRGIGLSTFLWGCMTWPLEVGQTLDFMSFLIVTIALFSICLAILSAGFEYRAMVMAAVGGSLSLGLKIAWLTPAIGSLLPIGFVIFIVTNIAYGLVIERQTHGGVMLELRSRRTSQDLAKVNAMLGDVLARTQRQASLDSLTQLRNRNAFESAINTAGQQFAGQQQAIMLLDIDHFKAINDRFGHQTGDGVLIAISTTLEQWENECPGRICARWGGEEFIAFVALRQNETISSVAEDLRKRIETLGEELYWPETIAVTTSIGCALLPSIDRFCDAVLQADQMLYTAKEAGRNRWRLAA